MAVVGAGFGALALVLALTLPFLDQEFIPGVDEGRLRVTAEMAPGTTLASTSELARTLEQRVLDTPAVALVQTAVGTISGGYRRFPERGAQYVEMRVGLVGRPGVLARIASQVLPWVSRGRPGDEEMAANLRRKLSTVPGARIEITTDRGRASETAPLQLELSGRDLRALSAAAQEVQNSLSRIPGVIYPSSSTRAGKPELDVRVDPDRARLLRVPVAQAGLALRDSLEGNTDLTYQEYSRGIPIRVRYKPGDLSSEEDLRSVIVASRPGGVVRLGDIAKLDPETGPQQVLRQDRQRLVMVTANLDASTSLEQVQKRLEPALRKLPAGITLHWGGEAEDMAISIGPMITALLLAVVLVYALMAGLFNSLVHPFTIMLSLPMALVGALSALAIFGESLSVVVMIGVIMLVGLVAKNAILLVDYTNTLRARGSSREEAILEAGPTRLRPILMTTFSTTLAMAPIALKLGQGAEVRSPMAITVIGGLLLSTLLTLVVIPVMYTVMDDFSRKWAR
jgi:HAE1 family hydrophobic/amphiphilic exporter-1